MAFDRGDAVGDGDGRQGGAVTESATPDRGDAVGDGDGRQGGAAIESIVSDRGYGNVLAVNVDRARNDNVGTGSRIACNFDIRIAVPVYADSISKSIIRSEAYSAPHDRATRSIPG